MSPLWSLCTIYNDAFKHYCCCALTLRSCTRKQFFRLHNEVYLQFFFASGAREYQLLQSGFVHPSPFQFMHTFPRRDSGRAASQMLEGLNQSQYPTILGQFCASRIPLFVHRARIWRLPRKSCERLPFSRHGLRDVQPCHTNDLSVYASEEYPQRAQQRAVHGVVALFSLRSTLTIWFKTVPLTAGDPHSIHQSMEWTIRMF